jgi:hypothetical protein
MRKSGGNGAHIGLVAWNLEWKLASVFVVVVVVAVVTI